MRGRQAEHVHGLGLPDAVAPVHRLHVRVRVPVRVVDDDRVRGGEVDAEATGSGRQQEDADIWVGVELVHLPSTFLPLHAPVDAAHLLALLLKVGLDQVEHLRHLREDERLVTLRPELGQQAVQQAELAALLHQLIRGGEHDAPVHPARYQIRVVAVLAQLHQHVVQRGGTHRHRAGVAGYLLEQVRDCLVHQRVVELSLRLHHVRVEDNLFFARQVGLHVTLKATEQEGLEDAVQLIDHLDALAGFLVVDAVVLLLLLGKVEPALELRQGGEDVGEEKVQQRPQLREGVLQRCSSQQQLVRGRDGLQLADEFAVEVLQAVALVDDQVLEVVLLQKLAIGHDDLEGGDDHRESILDRAAYGQPAVTNLRALLP